MTTEEKPVRREMQNGRSGDMGRKFNTANLNRPVSRPQSAQQVRRAFPSPFSPTVAPPTPAINHVLQWTLSTESGELSTRLDMFAQAILSKIASTPNEWFDLSKTIIKFDLLPDILSRIAEGSSNQQFSNFSLTLERDGNKVRFVRAE